MPRQDCKALRDRSLVLVFIAGSVREAERVEAALTSAGIDYCLDRVEFGQGILLSSRAGMGFYVIEGQAPFARHELRKAGFRWGISEANT
jgi:hypothetical protein